MPAFLSFCMNVALVAYFLLGGRREPLVLCGRCQVEVDPGCNLCPDCLAERRYAEKAEAWGICCLECLEARR